MARWLRVQLTGGFNTHPLIKTVHYICDFKMDYTQKTKKPKGPREL